MKAVLYDQIVAKIRAFRGLTRDCAEMLIKEYPSVSTNAIHGIISSEVQTRMKTCRNLLHGTRYDYLEQYKQAERQNQPPGIIVRMAAYQNLPPALLARVILEKHMKKVDPKVSRSDISRYLKDSSLIQDLDLAYEIYLCVLYDDRNGLISDAFCASIGYEFEKLLQSKMEEHNIAYQTEEQLRTRGYDKTPDLKLEAPIAVGGFIVNWIESKARFGTPSIHDTHVKDQFLSYWNRFGPGLVIYWFGFVNEIVQPIEKKFIVLDHFPENITYMDPSIVKFISKSECS